jgi:Tir chaperone protein (CesT) family
MSTIDQLHAPCLSWFSNRFARALFRRGRLLLARVWFHQTRSSGRRRGWHLADFTELGALPESDKLVLLEEMLEANVFFYGTGGATLGTLPGGKALLSQRGFVAALEAPEFQALLENFVSVAETWKSRLTEQPEDSLPSFGGIGATNPGQFA